MFEKIYSDPLWNSQNVREGVEWEGHKKFLRRGGGNLKKDKNWGSN